MDVLINMGRIESMGVGSANASTGKFSEHPPYKGWKLSKHSVGNIGCKDESS